MRRLATALGCAALLLAGAAAAQEAPPAAPPPVPAPIEPIALAQVAERADEAERTAATIGEIAAPVAQIANIESELEANTEASAERAARTKALAGDPSSLVALDDDVRAWELTRDQLATARATLTERIAALEAALADLARQAEVWKVTDEAARAAGAPAPVLERIRKVRQTLRTTRGALEGRRDALLALQTRLAEEEKRAADSLALLAEARDSFRSLLLLRDSPPLWRAVTAEGRTSLVQDVSDRIGVRARSFVRFFERAWERALVHAGLLAIALAATLALRQRAQAWRADDPRLEASAVVFERPFSAALLIALLATPVLHPNAPRVVDNVAIALLVIPLLRLLPRLLEPALVPISYGLAALAVLDQLRDVLERRPFAERTLLLVQTLAAAALLAWMLRAARLAALPAGTRLPRWLGRIQRLALGALVLAALANVAGWVNLSRVLASGVLGSAYLALILYGGVRVLRTAMRALLRSEGARQLGVVRRHASRLALWARRAVDAAALLAWATWTLVAFGLGDAAREAFGRLLSAEASFGAADVSLGDLLAFLLTLGGSLLLARLLRVLLDEDVVPRLPARRGLGAAITSTVHYGVIAVGFLLAVSAAGVDLNRFSLLAGALGVGVGFGLQNVVNNFVSGLILLYERPVQLGDTIEVGGVSGQVRRIGIRSSTIRTAQGAEVIVPNGDLISLRVINWTFADRPPPRASVKVRVAYGSDPERVIALLEGVARAHPHVREDPPPQAVFLGFGESALEFELGCVLAPEAGGAASSELAIGVSRALADAGIAIPFPQRELHVHAADGKPPPLPTPDA